jgi:hypothetical protein
MQAKLRIALSTKEMAASTRQPLPDARHSIDSLAQLLKKKSLKMNDNNYSAPQSNLTLDGADIDELLQPLLATRPWVRLCSIMGFIMTAFTVLVGISLMVGMGAIAGSGAYGVGFGIGTGLVYVLMSLLTFFPSLFLFKYASAITQADRSQNSEDIRVALRYQKSFWKFIGIVTLIYLVLFGVVLVFGIIGGVGAALMS